jgi:hypothetical protein
MPIKTVVSSRYTVCVSRAFDFISGLKKRRADIIRPEQNAGGAQYSGEIHG